MSRLLFLLNIAVLSLLVSTTLAQGNNNNNNNSSSNITQTGSSPKSCPLPTNERILLTDQLTMKEVVNPFTNQITIQLEYQGGDAWIGFAITDDQRQMLGSEAVIGKPDENTVQKYSLESTTTDGIVAMSTDSQTLENATIVQANGVTTLTFTKLLVEDNNNNGEKEILANGPNYFLYAVGSSNTFGIHALKGSVTLSKPLLQCTINGTTPDYSSNEAGDDGSGQSADAKLTQQLWMAHGWLMAISWGVLTPIAIGSSILRKRLGNKAAGTWYVLHSNINTLSFACTLAGFGIAVYSVAASGVKQFSGNLHKFLGIIVFSLVCLQVVSGLFRPNLPNEEADKQRRAAAAAAAAAAAMEEPITQPGLDNINSYEERPPRKSIARMFFEVQHRILGLGLLVLCWYQCTLGIEQYNILYDLSFPATSIFWIVAGVITALIVLGRVAIFMLE
jgi:hypothetical protein